MVQSYRPTQAMRNAARRGLALRREHGRGGLSTQEAGRQGIGSGVARASAIIRGNISLAQVRRIAAYWARHRRNYNPSRRHRDGGPTAGTIAGLLWGGPGAERWARSIINRVERQRKRR